ncbi:CHD3-type chromatin-remodeling factor PICKLE-like isoform X1 [Panicum miliaceum]|uniref:CHD3-type chromatin-remodeling factor PICKLE-like isoform X1 n=1 Tax=Panicum miliaceum TaxID=4540 RepID=A0A3L6PJC3_PANMI|nr:CHD3-type chromatin-remodeling factor PICKLE-like isoform X1 [Panicum miliaceum]
MTPKWNECSSNSYRELSSHVIGESKSTLTETVLSPTSCFDLPTANTMCSLSPQKKDGNVYKRRKMDKDSNSLATNEESKETMQSCTTSDEQSSLVLPAVSSEAVPSNSTANMIGRILDCEGPTGVSLERNSGTNVSNMSPSSMILYKKDAPECSSSNISPAEPITEHMSPRDLCIAILKKDGLITESRARIKDEFTDNDANPLLTCNTCGCLDRSLKMLICDSCEVAFHLPCCIPCIKEPPTDEWYCAPCLCKKPKSLYGKLLEGKVKPSRNTNQKPHDMSHIEYMLKDAEPYVTGVRIGRDFQAEVLEWSGPTSSSDGYFDEPSEFDPAELTNFNLRKTSNQSQSSIGNWIQCRETLNPGDSDKQVVCGKWRRAPLYVVQTDDWECFSCLLWDPAHADCAVPQGCNFVRCLSRVCARQMSEGALFTVINESIRLRRSYPYQLPPAGFKPDPATTFPAAHHKASPTSASPAFFTPAPARLGTPQFTRRLYPSHVHVLCAATKLAEPRAANLPQCRTSARAAAINHFTIQQTALDGIGHISLIHRNEAFFDAWKVNDESFLLALVLAPEGSWIILCDHDNMLRQLFWAKSAFYRIGP